MIDRRNLVLIAIAAAIVGFMLGALWQYAATRGSVRDLEDTRTALAFQELNATLGAATVEAQRGNFEIARQLSSDFFSGLQAQIGSAETERRGEYEELLQQRDPIITALSRGDPQTGSMLAQMLTRFRIALGQPVGPTPATQSPEAAPSTTGS